MTDLITRLSKLDAPDREVDAEICILFQYGGLNSEGATNVRTDPDWDGDLLFEIGNEDCCNPIPKLTASIDAVIALTERELPEWQGLYLSTEWTGIKSPGNGITHSAQLRKTLHSYISADGEGANLAIALCIALLRAKEASNAE